MNNLSLYIALRYFRSKKSGFVSMVSTMGFLGISIGVAVLILVTSVMNGFQKELETRILQAVPHASIEGSIRSKDLNEIDLQLKLNKNYLGSAPYIETQGLLSSKYALKGIVILGVEPAKESLISIIDNNIIDGTWESLEEDSYNLLIGKLLAIQLGVGVGDRVNVLVPSVSASLTGMLPRTKQFTISGVFNIGAPELDESFAYMNLKNSSKLLKMKGYVHGVRVSYQDLFSAPIEIKKDLFLVNNSLGLSLNSSDWTYSYGTLFKAIKNEKFLVSLLLVSIVLVAIFSVVTMLIMIINEKKSQIAVLITLGGSKRFIQKIFILFGSLIGFFGTLVGFLSGWLITYYFGSLIHLLENLFNVKFLEVYFIDYFPIDMRPDWIFFICFFSFLLCVVSSFYPARIAAKIEPSEVLKYE